MRNQNCLIPALLALAVALGGCKGDDQKKEAKPAPKEKKEAPAPEADKTPAPQETEKAGPEAEEAPPAVEKKEPEARKEEAAPTAAAEEEEEEITDTVVARVNGKDIDVSDYVERLKKLTKGKVTRSMLKKTVIDRMINEELLRQEVEKLAISVSDEEIADAMNMDMERYARQKAAMGARVKSFEDRVATRKLLEARSLLAVPSDEELQKEYQRRFGVKIDAVTFPVGPTVTPEEATAAEADAKAVLEAATGGITLREAVREKKDAGGRRILVRPMFIKKGDERHAELWAAAEKLQEKDFAGPVKTAQGLVVFQLSKRIEPRQTFEEMKDKLAKSSLNMKTAQAKHKLLEDLRREAKIEYLIEFKPGPDPSSLRDLRGGRLSPGLTPIGRDVLRGPDPASLRAVGAARAAAGEEPAAAPPDKPADPGGTEAAAPPPGKPAETP